MRTVTVALAILLYCVCLKGHAQFFINELSVHPENIDPNGSFLILIEDNWSDVCRGTVTVDIQSDTIEILSTLTSPTLDRVCAAVVVPFKKLISPRDLAGPEFTFAGSVTVNYRYDAGGGPQLVVSEQIAFNDSATNPSAQIQSGAWISSDLESSGLFIDQQGAILSATLADYGDSGEATWLYGGGSVFGNTFSGKLIEYDEFIVCVTEPCPRAAPRREGSVYMLLRNRNELIVQYQDVLESPKTSEDFAFDYQRLVFRRSPELSGLELPIPDLIGEWVGGTRGSDDVADDFRLLDIEYRGLDSANGLDAYAYRATQRSSANSAAFEFDIVCVDARPVDGERECSLRGYTLDGDRCDARFTFANVGVDRVQAVATCMNDADSYGTHFDLFRAD